MPHLELKPVLERTVRPIVGLRCSDGVSQCGHFIALTVLDPGEGLT